jgi:uncharacterized protein (TIGR03435 family)
MTAMRILISGVLVTAAVGLAAWTSGPLDAQESGARFEVASVKPNVGRDLSITFRAQPLDGLTYTNFPLESIIRFAYSVQPFRVFGMPSWTREERFDIAAKAARTITDDERRVMLRALLAERFQLKVHFETRERTIFVMTAARADKRLGPGLNPRPECDGAPCDSGGGGRGGSIRIRAVTLTQLADGMLSTVREELVRDETGIPGKFDVELSWRPESSADPDDSRPAFPTAMQEQLGLKLEPLRRPVEMLVIDSVSRPTPD